VIIMTLRTDTAGRIPESPPLQAVSDEMLTETIRALREEVVPAQTVIFRQGDPGDTLFLIRSGKVRIFRKDRYNVETDLSVLGPGESFGEVALLTGKARSANVQSLEETRLNVVSRDQFDGILSASPQIFRAVINRMSEWLRRDEARLEEQAQHRRSLFSLSRFDFGIIFGLSLLIGIMFNAVNPNGISLVPPLDLGQGLTKVPLAAAARSHQLGNTLFVDARAEKFYSDSHIPGAVHMPWDAFDISYMAGSDELEKAEEVIVYGRNISSRADEVVADKLTKRGHKNIKILSGSLSAWGRKGYPVES
jgi:CRP-like cAMP-binding protein/rhodanese-related sulfurtransferase